jgi:hypothetical protein
MQRLEFTVKVCTLCFGGIHTLIICYDKVEELQAIKYILHFAMRYYMKTVRLRYRQKWRSKIQNRSSHTYMQKRGREKKKKKKTPWSCR